ncbi:MULTISPECIES: hypothetical protein [Micrococcales]|uniref:hypothetical protein n=1 Tax=Micrococcales TaxID=85006 RepID=UPI0004AB5232|nr:MULTISPECIES: hypothetical protein [Micrococcales]
MDIAILILMTVSALAGAASCFRVPAVSVRSRQYWAATFVALLAAAGVLAAVNDAVGNGSASPVVAVLVPVLATAAAALTGSPVTAAILELSMRSDQRYRQASADRSDHAGRLGDIEDPERTSSLHGGLWIGVLERVGVVVTILVGWPTGLTVLAAIKALGRFTELKRSDAVERFILGTFASFLWAAAWAGVSILLIRGG